MIETQNGQELIPTAIACTRKAPDVQASKPFAAGFRKGTEKRSLDHFHLAEALKQSEERFRELSHEIELIALILDARGNVVFCNPYLLRLIGWRKEEILGRNWCDLCVPWEQYPRQVFTSQLGSASIPARHANEIISRGGTRHWIDWYNTILFDRDGDPIGTASVGHLIGIDVFTSNPA